ncbi:hypothetical protein [Myroides injenensis]|uniref:hypothetical protein n=1 Tax=Myroides injenensis TaxID=1183151 RepID=UPI0002888C12|nr:hypothetical protein [Myroides injenensis]
MNIKRGLLVYSIALCSFIGVISCKKGDEASLGKDVVARVNNSYLTEDQLKELIPIQLVGEDSIALLQKSIDKWATKQLLIDVAEFNLSDEKKSEINDMVENFKSDLLIKAYLEKLVQNKIDTVVSSKDLHDFYDLYKENFIVDDMLVKLSYVNVLNDNTNFSKIKKKFNSKDRKEFNSLENLSLQMKSYALNDSIWIDVKNIYDKLPFLNVENRDSYLKNNNNFEVNDENSTYFVKVNAVKSRGSVIPYDYMEKSLRLLVLNDRKVELLKMIQEDILKDAKNNKRYEVFK